MGLNRNFLMGQNVDLKNIKVMMTVGKGYFSSGTLLTIWMVKNADGVVSIVQAHKLGSGT